MKVNVTSKKIVMVPTEVVETETREYPVNVYPVQYRNYPHTVHIQGTAKKLNRHYGFAFDIPGQSSASDNERHSLSYAGTGMLYWSGSLVVNGTTATLIGINGDTFDVPMDNLLNGLK